MDRGERRPKPSGAASLHVCSLLTPPISRLLETIEAAAGVHPVTLLALEPADTALGPPGATVLTLDDLVPDLLEQQELRLIYDANELAGAMVPRLLDRLLPMAPHGLLFLGPTVEVHAPLDPVAAALADHSIVLAPVLRTPLPDDDLEPDEHELLRHGQIVGSHVAVRAGAEGFLRWWIDRTRWDALADDPQGLTGAARWLDLAPSLFDVGLLREPGVAMTSRSLTYTDVERSGTGWAVEGVPLVSIDLAGFDPSHPELLDARLGTRPRVLLSERPGLRQLLDDRADALTALGVVEGDRHPSPPWLDARVRRMARAALRHAAARGEPAPFDVLSPGHSDLRRWLNEPVSSPGVTITRLLHAVWAGRADLRAVFREPLGRDGQALVAWARNDQAFLAVYGDIHHPPERCGPMGTPTPGLNLVGFLNAELGLGEAARLLARAAAAGGVPYAAINFHRTDSRQSVTFAAAQGAPFDTTLLCVNADLTPLASANCHGALDEGRHRIGYWFWEVDQFPAEQRDALHFVDELWTASSFVADTLRSVTDKPVSVIPQPVAEPSASHLTRADLDLGLSDRFTFAFWFDAFSSVERKNPAAVVRAFTQAFAPGEGPMLLIKSINGDHDRAALERVRRLAAGRSDIVLSDGYLAPIAMRSLVQHIDCYVSLHRSEGFGQTLADAMMAGKPVIATGYSGNLAFMSERNSLLVPYTLAEVGHGNPPYPSGAHWADPDVDAAAEMMRWVVAHPSRATDLGRRGAADIRRTHSLEVAGAHLARQFLQAVGGVSTS